MCGEKFYQLKIENVFISDNSTDTDGSWIVYFVASKETQRLDSF